MIVSLSTTILLQLFNDKYVFYSIPSLEPQATTSSQGKSKTTEPNIDFELDVKVHINSGKCVLHTKDLMRDEEMKM